MKHEKPKLHIAATGCCLMDYLYTQVDFNSPVFQKVLSRTPGDGGLQPGALVFAEEFEAFANVSFMEWLNDLTQGRPPNAENLGGPAIVALVHAAQMLHDQDVVTTFHAGCGRDDTEQRMREMIGQTPVDASGYRQVDGPSPSTVVLSDPTYHDGKGERTFINTIGSAGTYTADMLGDDFFNADIRLFGATALVPNLHDELTECLQRGRERGGVNIVGTVYDFRNEQRYPEQPWPLGESALSFPLIDLLVCDCEEALKISGCTDLSAAIEHFLEGGIGSVVVTHGAEGLHVASQGGLFAPISRQPLPVCQAIDEELDRHGRQGGDTTGCGDNFLGGMLTSLALQILDGKKQPLDLMEVCAWGAASGGFACFYPGGTFMESTPGEKYEKVRLYYEAYRAQLEAR